MALLVLKFANSGALPSDVPDGTLANAGGALYVRAAGTWVLASPAAHAATHEAGGTDEVTLAQSQISGLADTLADKADLDSGGKVPMSQLPAIAITNTFVVASQSAMLALSTAETGDVAVRTDINKSFILTADTPSVLGAWQELLSPPDAVVTVFGRTGAVTAMSGDYSASDITGLGGAATKNVGSTAGTVAAGDDSRFLTVATQAEASSSPNATVYVDSLTAAASVTNADFALVPKGSGALLAQVPNAGVGGGDKRGTYAVDFQRSRALASQVASGAYSTVAGGRDNTASGNSSGSLSGYGNNSSGPYGVIAGGTGNTVGVVGQGTIAGGSGNYVADDYAMVPGGLHASTRGYGALALAAGRFSTTGDAQFQMRVQRRSTTNATPAILTGDAAAPSATTVAYLPNSAAYKVRAEVVCRESSSGSTKAWTLEALVRRGSSASLTFVSGAVTATVFGADSGTSTWDATLVADATRGSVEVQVTGETGKTLKWVATVFTTEVVG